MLKNGTQNKSTIKFLKYSRERPLITPTTHANHTHTYPRCMASAYKKQTNGYFCFLTLDLFLF